MITVDLPTVLDHCITIRLASLERQIRADMDTTGPEDESALDQVPDPDAAWRRLTLEEVLWRERAALERWRARLLAVFDERVP